MNPSKALWIFDLKVSFLQIAFFFALISAGTTTAAAAADARPIATVVLQEGPVYAIRGNIHFNRARVGESVKVNLFGQYKDSPPLPTSVFFDEESRRRVHPGDSVADGEILQTDAQAWAKVLFSDDSILDLGPITLAQLAFHHDENSKLLKLAYGKIRSIVTKPIVAPNLYQILTPSALLGARGTEYLVNVFPGSERAPVTEVICIHGQVSVDLGDINKNGLIHHRTLVVNPGSFFRTEGVHGLAEEYSTRTVSQEELQSWVRKDSPNTNVFASVYARSPEPTRIAPAPTDTDDFAPISYHPSLRQRRLHDTNTTVPPLAELPRSYR